MTPLLIQDYVIMNYYSKNPNKKKKEKKMNRAMRFGFGKKGVVGIGLREEEDS